MPAEDRRDEPTAPRGRFADDLIGLDPTDPDVQAFAAHLDRMQRLPPAFTVEGSLAGVGDFADSANRARGFRRLSAVTVVALILFGVLVVIWDAVVFALGVLFAVAVS